MSVSEGFLPGKNATIVCLGEVSRRRQPGKRQTKGVCRVATSRATLIAATHDDFVSASRAGKSANPEFCLTTDGVHLNPVGNTVMALSGLAALGFAGL